MIENTGKEALRRAMLKSKSTDKDDIDFLQTMFRIDSAFFTKVEPIKTRKYNKNPVSTPVESENEEEEAEEEEEEDEPLPIKSPYQRKKEAEQAVRDQSLKEIIADIKLQIAKIATNEVPALAAERDASSKDWNEAKKKWMEEYPRDAQSQDCTDKDYEKMLKSGTKKQRKKYFAKKKELENKNDEVNALKESLKLKEDELLNNAEGAILDGIGDGSDSDSDSGSSTSSSSSSEFDDSQSQTQLA